MINSFPASAFEANADVIVSCDGNNKFRKQLKKRYPEVSLLYKKHMREDIGTLFVFPQVAKPDIASVFIKQQGTVNLSILLQNLKIIKKSYPHATIAFPYNMGMACPDNDWKYIVRIIHRLFEDYDGTVLLCL